MNIQMQPYEKRIFEQTFELQPGKSVMDIITDTPAHTVGKDPRLLAFSIKDMKYSIVD